MGEVYSIEESKWTFHRHCRQRACLLLLFNGAHRKAGAEAGLSQTNEGNRRADIVRRRQMLLESPEDTAVLKDNITSPNGTTAAGLKALEESGGGEAIEQAVKQAAKRSKTISLELEQLVTAK